MKASWAKKSDLAARRAEVDAAVDHWRATYPRFDLVWRTAPERTREHWLAWMAAARRRRERTDRVMATVRFSVEHGRLQPTSPISWADALFALDL